MKKVLLQTFLGIVLSLAGIFVGYIYITGINNGISPLFLLLSMILIGVAVYFFILASRSDPMVKYTLQEDKNGYASQASLGNRLQKNNELTQTWAKTLDQQHKLRMLELSGRSQNS